MTNPPLVLFGAGRMGAALCEGWIQGTLDRSLIVVEPSPSGRLETLASEGVIALNPTAAPAGILAICVKPQIFPRVLHDIRPWVGPETLILSIMAGVKLRQLSERLGASRVVRAMPNTPGAIGRGVSLLAVSAEVSKSEVALARSLLEPLGAVEGPMVEDQLSIATALSGCGPAYLFLLAEVLADAGKAAGLVSSVADRISEATITGSAALLEASDDAPSILRKAVTSPNGVTQAALDVLMGEQGLPSLMKKAVDAAILRDEALSAVLDEESEP
ncbi:MAG: pyrroline-5-carboxylate reductase [Pseudomonadota bacterium]